LPMQEHVIIFSDSTFGSTPSSTCDVDQYYGWWSSMMNDALLE
jgi:hypothetical protein